MSEKKDLPHLIRRSVLVAGAAVLGVAAAFVLAYSTLPVLLSVSYTNSSPVATPTFAEGEGTAPAVKHLPTPVPLKAIYMSQCVVGTPSFRDSLVKFIDDTDLNAVVIDIKDFTGKIAFSTDNPLLKNSVSAECGALDMQSFVRSLHEKDIYVIGRITTFQDPYYTSLHPEEAVQKKNGGVWKDFKGLAFVDVGATAYWDYIVELGKISYTLGFDELNFDYVRFPSDGPMSEAVYSFDGGKSKPQALEEFFKYLNEKLRHPSTSSGQAGPVLSADLFGMTATNEDDLNIGQILERALPYFDYIDPMVYPSHYPSGFHGYTDVNQHAYDIVKYSMDIAVARTIATTTKIASMAYTPIMKTVIIPATVDSTGSPQATTTREVETGLYSKPSYPSSKMRPWLQSFDYPVTYTSQMVRDQIQATSDAGLDSWLFWDAANKYTALRKVLAPAQ